jgi:hypothetical protein
MTETNSITELKKNFVKGGFVDSVLLIADICPIPERVFVMHNSYALVVGYAVLPEACATRSLLMEEKEQMHVFIRKILFALENNKGLIVDGYLLLSLDHEPNSIIEETVRDIEMDTKVCRKHVVWPSANKGSLDRLQFITILSLPEPFSSSSECTTPFELSTEANILLAKYDELGSLDRLLDAIKNGELADAD